MAAEKSQSDTEPQPDSSGAHVAETKKKTIKINKNNWQQRSSVRQRPMARREPHLERGPVVIGLRSLVLTACHFSMSAQSRGQVQRSVAILAQAFGSSPSPGPVAHSVMERKAASSCVGRFSAKAAAELGQHLVEEHQSPLVNCMHTQSLVGHTQVDNTVLQAARNVHWRNEAVEFFAYHFERVRLRDECFVAMLALMDRMTVLSTRRAKCEREFYAE